MIRLRVLVVDDDPAVREIVAMALEGDPIFILRGCGSSREALRTAVEWRPDLVLLDAMMPDMNGRKVLRRLRADEGTAPIPVVVMIAGAQRRQRERLKALGAAGVIAKPLDRAGLAAELRRFVRVEGPLAAAREHFLQRLKTDAGALSVCRRHLSQPHAETALQRIREIAHALAGAGGIYGFAGITCESVALSLAAESNLAGRTKPREVEHALGRLLRRIQSR
jgi:CheY-like chemotaxis protein